MKDGFPIKPLRPTTNVPPAPVVPQNPSATEAPKATPDAIISGVKPELSSAAEADKAAKDLIEQLSGSGAKGLEAFGTLDAARLKQLLSDD